MSADEGNSESNMAELQETVSRLSSHKGVEAVDIWKGTKDVISGDPKQVAAAQKLLDSAKEYFATVSGGSDDPVSFIQVKSNSGIEVMVAPHEGFVLAVRKR